MLRYGDLCMWRVIVSYSLVWFAVHFDAVCSRFQFARVELFWFVWLRVV